MRRTAERWKNLLNVINTCEKMWRAKRIIGEYISFLFFLWFLLIQIIDVRGLRYDKFRNVSYTLKYCTYQLMYVQNKIGIYEWRKRGWQKKTYICKLNVFPWNVLLLIRERNMFKSTTVIGLISIYAFYDTRKCPLLDIP